MITEASTNSLINALLAVQSQQLPPLHHSFTSLPLLPTSVFDQIIDGELINFDYRLPTAIPVTMGVYSTASASAVGRDSSKAWFPLCDELLSL